MTCPQGLPQRSPETQEPLLSDRATLPGKHTGRTPRRGSGLCGADALEGPENQDSSSSSSLVVLDGSTGMPGPIVVEMVALVM